MKVTSIDNCYEDDGLVMAQQQIAMFNQPREPREVLIAIVPEYREDGRLDRLNFCTQRVDGGPRQNPTALDHDLHRVCAAIVAQRQADHDAAVKALDDSPITVVKHNG
jgi:hypothetical protein